MNHFWRGCYSTVFDGNRCSQITRGSLPFSLESFPLYINASKLPNCFRSVRSLNESTFAYLNPWTIVPVTAVVVFFCLPGSSTRARWAEQLTVSLSSKKWRYAGVHSSQSVVDCNFQFWAPLACFCSCRGLWVEEYGVRWKVQLCDYAFHWEQIYK